MSRRALAFLIVVVAIAALWQPLVYPGGKAALVLLDVYSPSFVGTDLAALVTPPPRVSDTTETFGGIAMRVSWWRPGWGDRHPAILIVNGATLAGNDDAVTRQFGATLARAGYLVMLPEFPFLKEGRLDPDAPRVVDAAFTYLHALPETRDRPVGAFGASVGAAIMLAAAGSEPALARADHLTVLGGYFDLYTYVASVATRSQRNGSSSVVPWEPSPEAAGRVPAAIFAAMSDDADRETVRAAFTATTYQDALDRMRSVSASGRAVLDRLSPATVWASVAPPVFWIHDPDDAFEPLSEAFAAEAAPRRGRFQLVVPRLLQHAEVSPDAGAKGPLFVIGELWRLLTFTLDVLRVAG